MNVTDFSQFYKGSESITNYGSGNGKKDTLVRYEFNTKDADGNTVMEKMSREESIRVTNEISSQYGDNVIVEFSGDGLAQLVQGKKLMNREPTEEEKAARAEKESAFQAMIKPANANPVVSYEELKKINYSKEVGAPIFNSYSALLGSKAYDYRMERGDGYYSVISHAEDLTKAYAFMYDEIVKGYEDGTRKVYMEDATAEKGYREMTMEEELKALDDAFAKQGNMIDTMVKNSKKAAEALKAYSERLARDNRRENADEVKEQQEQMSKSLKQTPDDLGSRMLNVSELFKKEYQTSKGFSMDFLTKLMGANFYLKN